MSIAGVDASHDVALRSWVPDHEDMNRLMRTQPAERLKLRHALSDGLREGSAQESAWHA
jgi:hypothetical protein